MTTQTEDEPAEDEQEERGIFRVTLDWLYSNPWFSGILEIEPVENEAEARARLLQEAIDRDFD